MTRHRNPQNVRSSSGSFTGPVLALFERASYIYLKAGSRRHRYIAVWLVVVENRVFVRSWECSDGGWYGTLRKDPVGSVRVSDKTFKIRAVATRSERLKDLVSKAYVAKYGGSSMKRYATDLGRAASRRSTTELVPQT